MVLQFTSDGSVQGTGFDATYSCAASSSSSSSSACTTIRCVPQSPPIPQVPSGVAKAALSYLLPSSYARCIRIRPGATLSGNIASAHEKDYYCLSATGGQTYEIGVDLASLGDSVLEVYSPDGVTKIAEDDDGGSGTASYLVWTAPGTGQYRLAVRGYGSDTGTYTISVQDSAAADPCNGSGGASLSGSGDIFFSDQYENSASCQWTLSCSSGHPHIHFSQFETERNFDFVNVYDGSSSGPAG
jgi:hypothetical protein